MPTCIMKKAKLVFVFQKYVLRLFVLNLILYQQDDIILKKNSNISLKTSEEKNPSIFSSFWYWVIFLSVDNTQNKIQVAIVHNDRNIYCSATLSFLHALSAWLSRAPISTAFYLAKKSVKMGANKWLKKQFELWQNNI